MTKLTKLSLLAAASAAILALTGCAGPAQMTPEQIASVTNQATTYDQSHSRAWNIAKVMGISKYVKDSYLEEVDLNKFASNGNMSALDKATWYTGTTLLTGNPFDIGSMILLFAPSTDDYMKEPIYMGFMPKDKAPTAAKAFQTFQLDCILSAYTKAAEDMGFQKADSKYFLKFKREKTADKDSGEITIKLASANNGTLSIAHETKLPSWLGSSDETFWGIGVVPSYKLTTNTLFVDDNGSTLIKQDSDYMLKIELMERMAKYLPDNTFVFVPSLRNEEGKHTPAYIADNKQKYFFVMPKSAEPAAQNQ